MNKFLNYLMIISALLPQTSTGQGFLDAQRYRGWLWFEDAWPLRPNDPAAALTPQQAKAEIDQFARELAALKFLMLARPTPFNVRAYRDKEQLMWRQAERLHDSWDMANLLYPEQRDLINNPVNVHSVKARRRQIEITNVKAIKNLARNFNLVLFFKADCPYCQLLSPVLKSFGQQYGFNIEAASAGGNAKHPYFRTVPAFKLSERLSIKAFPTIVAVSNDGKIAFELIRGLVSISELEEYSLLAIRYLQTL